MKLAPLTIEAFLEKNHSIPYMPPPEERTPDVLELAVKALRSQLGTLAGVEPVSNEQRKLVLLEKVKRERRLEHFEAELRLRRAIFDRRRHAHRVQEISRTIEDLARNAEEARRRDEVRLS